MNDRSPPREERALQQTRDLVGMVQIHLQPILDLRTGCVWGYEALARLADAPARPIDEAIASAHVAGFGQALEIACVEAALSRRDELPPGMQLALNLSPDVLTSPAASQRWEADLAGVVVEVTEHRASEPAQLRHELEALRARGASIAIDDVGTGYAGLLRLATMRPDFVKLDRTIVSGARGDDAKIAVLEALVGFSHRLGAAVVGEGVETLEDLAALLELGVDYGQGWAIGRPTATAEPVDPRAAAACGQKRGRPPISPTA